MTKHNCVYNDADEFEVTMKQIKDTQFSGRETKEKRSGEKQGGGQE